MKHLDCTLRDGGYYNNWNFSEALIAQYITAMQAAGVQTIELGLRSLKNSTFSGACAYTTDAFLNTLDLPPSMTIGVMVNGSELVGKNAAQQALQLLFPNPASESPVDLVRIACHVHEFAEALPAASWLKEKGYDVGFNLMQIANCSESEIKALAKLANNYPLDVLYFADSMGSMSPEEVVQIIHWLRSEWQGALGIHTHDNLGLALSNTLRAMDEGVTWVDSTVTGMGRGPGNARTEELAIEIAARTGILANLIPLMTLLREHFKPMQVKYGWGTNPYYYLAGKYGIHPTYVQEMLGDSRFGEEDILAVIEYLRNEGGKKFSVHTLDAARHFYRGAPSGQWAPEALFAGQNVLLLGTGPGVAAHRQALEHFIRQHKPVVMALNTQSSIAAELIDVRVACHPVRLLADCEAHIKLPQPLITPYSMLPLDVQGALANKNVLDFGLNVQPDIFTFENTHCTIPTSLVVAYAMAVASSGKAKRILMAGFDGYPGEDPRNADTNKLLRQYQDTPSSTPLLCLTPTRYDINCQSIYGPLK
ncbi:aldolase catalytic domain-containing protein [Pseudomonas sp. NC26]|uniref:Aldolase n=1 Tax=Pseudomonas putida TaxID=303 RepID=A0A7W2L531_PSEPU|nr:MULTISPECIES: aldolase catalytic domain-containing protein [Pseudomonas]MBA6118461.1 aldolase [Pseudomonas putida]MEC4875958.1 aldolase catalytic domain-containing protein [Pseudomonas sp. NC26]PZQ37054.1 MAG: aldolase [Pseudomonas putida]QNL89225.1 4-hydroxy-2-oxovalerate aldolase [Pseudomonas putida]